MYSLFMYRYSVCAWLVGKNHILPNQYFVRAPHSLCGSASKPWGEGRGARGGNPPPPQPASHRYLRQYMQLLFTPPPTSTSPAGTSCVGWTILALHYKWTHNTFDLNDSVDELQDFWSQQDRGDHSDDDYIIKKLVNEYLIMSFIYKKNMYINLKNLERF